jgi:hypothetical protein
LVFFGPCMSARDRKPGDRWFDPPIETRKDTFYRTLLEWWLANVPHEVRWLLWTSYERRPGNLDDAGERAGLEILWSQMRNPPPSR